MPALSFGRVFTINKEIAQSRISGRCSRIDFAIALFLEAFIAESRNRTYNNIMGGPANARCWCGGRLPLLTGVTGILAYASGWCGRQHECATCYRSSRPIEPRRFFIIFYHFFSGAKG